ncbi:F-box protein At3g44326-like [Diospyros lotus]|uniref:F-box protein At3g44326-like n=1 Tax=Diospyros lotus TaxID=55363 RepID=UPI00224FF54B|nr:F-box protein At3g44326-like [Diospyros lotus]
MDSDSSATTGGGVGTAISAVHVDIIQTHILTRLDGPTLASACCASSQLHILSQDENLWRDVCNQTWPSTSDPLLRHLISTFPAGHRSFFSDSFSTLHHRHRSQTKRQLPPPPPPSELISAIDIHYQDHIILSRIHRTETVTGWFLCSPFRLDLLEPKETVPTPIKLDGANLEDNLTLSWVMIDPTQNRAANFSSRRPVSVNRHWLTGDIEVRYSVVLAGGRKGELVVCEAVVTCCGNSKEGGELQVKDVSFLMEDMEGKNLRGQQSLVILQEAVRSGERRKGKRGEERERRGEFLRMKRERRERNLRRERTMDMACIAAGVVIFLAWVFVLLRR